MTFIVVAASEERHGLLHALGGAKKAIARGIFADADEQFAIEVLGGDAVEQRSFNDGGGIWHGSPFYIAPGVGVASPA